jgi:hypothetical protein
MHAVVDMYKRILFRNLVANTLANAGVLEAAYNPCLYIAFLPMETFVFRFATILL